jgi:hypothetical protein
MGEMTYNKLSGWVKVDGVRVGQNRPTGRVLRIPMEQKYQGLPAHRVVKEELWIWETETAMEPVGEIVHLNGDPFDNRWKNLRDQNGMEVEAKDDLWLRGFLRLPSDEMAIGYLTGSGQLVDNSYGEERGRNVVKMIDDRPVVFWAGTWFSAEDVCWWLATGVWPERGVRIVNNDYCDLRLANLRRVV